MGDGGDPIESQKKKYKGRMKKICYCGLVWFFLGLVFFVVAIALLVSFSQYWNDNGDWRRGLAYTGVALVLVGLLMATVGIAFCVVLYMFYKRLSGDNSGQPHFKPPVYAYGDAPYPQQPGPGYSQVSTGTGTTNASSNAAPSAPAGGPPGSPDNAEIEVTTNTKF